MFSCFITTDCTSLIGCKGKCSVKTSFSAEARKESGQIKLLESYLSMQDYWKRLSQRFIDWMNLKSERNGAKIEMRVIYIPFLKGIFPHFLDLVIKYIAAQSCPFLFICWFVLFAPQVLFSLRKRRTISKHFILSYF